MKFLMLLIGLLVSVNLYAGELKIVQGDAGWGDASEREKYIELAKQNALLSLPLNIKIRSTWKGGGYACDRQSRNPKCYFSVYASYEDLNQTGATYFLSKGRSSGVDLEEDDVAIALAKKEARANARWACGGEIILPTSDWKIWKDEVGYTYSENKIQCLNQEGR